MLQIRVSSFFKKQELKSGRDYIFSFATKSELNSWVITLNLLRAKSIYDEFRNTFGIINFPFNHEKVGKEDIRKKKRPFIMPEKYGNRRKKSLNFYLMTTQIVNKFLKLKNNKDKLKSNKELDSMDLLDEQKALIENEHSAKLKERIECLLTVTLGYFMGVIQKNISSSSFENNSSYNLIIGEPDQLLVEAIENSKNYKKMIEEQEQSNSEDKQIIKNKKASSVVKVLIEGENIIPEFAEFAQKSIGSKNIINTDAIVNNKNKNENLINGFDMNENNINNINFTNEKDKEIIEKKQISEIIENNNIEIQQENEESQNNILKNNNNLNNSNDINNNEIINDNNDENENININISQKEEKNSNEEKDNMNSKENINSNGIDINNKNIEQFKYSPETDDKTDFKIFETEKKERKKSSFMEKDIDAKDKLKNLKIEVTCKNLEDQIKMLLDENNLINN